ncbi:MAG: response regulator transcription factor [Magnetococcales bacterium]|nr:response regulator transcription factor [Magnetococcales bacterium]
MSQRLLMIEDDRNLAAMVGEYLGDAGMVVTPYHAALPGLQALQHEQWDAVILDVMLPDLDGFEVCRRIRTQSDIPILMLTAKGEEVDRVVGLELGADDYLPKPFSPRELLARLRAIIRRHTPGSLKLQNQTLNFGRLEIDIEARQVRVGGEAKELTGHQFDILEAMAQNAGKVLSRDHLMDLVRGEELEAFDRSIDVHISRIRAAIEDDPKKPRRIITIRGSGYVFASKQDGSEVK